MGQKTHPYGLRLGIFRKWNNTWYASSKENKNLFFYQKRVEELFNSILNLYRYSKNSQTKKLWIVDIKIFKSGLWNILIFVFFYKFRSKKRKKNQRILRKRQIVLDNQYQFSLKNLKK